jgi:putative heme iron utilization protein
MLDLQFYVQATHVERRRAIYEQVVGQVREVLGKRRLKEFELERFLADMDGLLNSQLNGETSTRLDSFCLERASGF